MFTVRPGGSSRRSPSRLFGHAVEVLRCFAIVSSLMYMTARSQDKSDVARYVAAMLGGTPIATDLRELCDEIGGRVTGSESNRRAVEWGVRKFREAGVKAHAEPFTMPGLWLERSTTATVTGGLSFSPRVVAMPFSASTTADNGSGDLVGIGKGTQEDFDAAGDVVRGRFILVETEQLTDIDGLFREYAEASAIENRAYAAGVKGVVYMGSRKDILLYRHNASRGFANTLPMVTMARIDAERCARALQAGKSLRLTIRVDIHTGGPFVAENVIAEIPGGSRADEVIIIGAHLDSWDLGTGANDNGCNVAMMIDLARQLKATGIVPRRTIRFALWNGEEQGMYGSMGYAQTHSEELDRTTMAMSIDIGSGRINGFFTGGRPQLHRATQEVLTPVAGLGPFTNIDLPIVGTDNFDFMLQGVGNLVGNHEPAVYGPTYHAHSDTYDKVDLQTLKINAAIVAAVTLGFANMDDVDWHRQSRSEVEALVAGSDLEQQMRMFGIWDQWENGTRGRDRK